MQGHVCCEVCWTFMRIVGVSEPLTKVRGEDVTAEFEEHGASK